MGGYGSSSDIEIMRNIVFITKQTGMTYQEIMELPYAVFLAYLKHLRIFELEQTEEGRKLLMQTNVLNATEPDWARIRSQKVYKQVKGSSK